MKKNKTWQNLPVWVSLGSSACPHRSRRSKICLLPDFQIGKGSIRRHLMMQHVPVWLMHSSPQDWIFKTPFSWVCLTVRSLVFRGFRTLRRDFSPEPEGGSTSRQFYKISTGCLISRFFFFKFWFDYELCYKDSDKHCFFVVCEVILIENARPAKSGPQFSPCLFLHVKTSGWSFAATCTTTTTTTAAATTSLAILTWSTPIHRRCRQHGARPSITLTSSNRLSGPYHVELYYTNHTSSPIWYPTQKKIKYPIPSAKEMAC
jgi:hypothetical protein